jgi:NADH-quinone oxidoreductase subunit F
MDIHPIATPPSPEERAAIAAILGSGPELEAPVGLAAAQSRRHLLLPVLHALQSRVGWVSPGGLGEACRRLLVPPAEAYGVVTFYSLFSTRPRPRTVVHVCDDIACKSSGADRLCAELEARCGPPGAVLRLPPHQGDPGDPVPAAHYRGAGEKPSAEATWLRSPCLGLCESPTAAMLTVAGERPVELAWGGATADQVEAALRSHEAPRRSGVVPHQREGLRLLRRVGTVDPASLGAYRATGGYQALRRALEIGGNAVIREVAESGLMGRGGAAFPTGRKWAAVAAQPAQPRWLVCNADESEPGTFKDRVLMEGDPFRLVEAMTIAGLSTGCAQGIVYIRGEYPLAIERVAHAIAEARRHGLLGPDILGRGHRFELELRKGAGAYICGEETALFNSIEGLRGEPRSKPPFPVEVGLFGKPTLINNVETLCNVPDIVLEGGAAFARIGTAGSTGTRLFCLSGHVARPGIYEVAFGTSLRALLELAGGTPNGVSAVLLGGAAGTFLRPDELDLPLTFEDTRRVGATLGSGVVVVFDQDTALHPVLERVAAFFRDESCGQCVPCRVGSVRQQELLARVAGRRPHGGLAQERDTYAELSQCMRDASICGLGQTASSAIESALHKFPTLWEGR